MASIVKLNSQGVRDLLKSPKVRAELERRAKNIAAAAGEGHEVDVSETNTRARASVRTVTVEAMVKESQDKNLTRSIDAGRQ